MLDIEKIMADAIREAEEKGVFKLVIETAVTQTVVEKLQSHFRSYSDFGKMVEKAIEEKIKVDLSNMDFPEYNRALAEVVKARMDTFFDGEMKTSMNELIDEALGLPDKEITLSKIVEKMIEKYHDDEKVRDGAECVTCIVEHSDLVGTPYTHIYLDPKEDQSKYSCAFQIDLREGVAYSIKAGGYKLENTLFAGPRYGFEKLLFQLYHGKVKVITDKPVVNYPEGEENEY